MGMRVDQRKIMAFGLISLGWVLYNMSTWTPDVTAEAATRVTTVADYLAKRGAAQTASAETS